MVMGNRGLQSNDWDVWGNTDVFGNPIKKKKTNPDQSWYNPLINWFQSMKDNWNNPGQSQQSPEAQAQMAQALQAQQQTPWWLQNFTPSAQGQIQLNPQTGQYERQPLGGFMPIMGNLSNAAMLGSAVKGLPSLASNALGAAGNTLSGAATAINNWPNWAKVGALGGLGTGWALNYAGNRALEEEALGAPPEGYEGANMNPGNTVGGIDINQLPAWPPEETPPGEGNSNKEQEEPGVSKPGPAPQVIDVNGYKFYWNETGGLFGTGGWEVLPNQYPTAETPEQQLAREKALQDQQNQAAMQRAMFEAESQRQKLKLEQEFQRQEAIRKAQEDQMNMYRANPYLYWAQLGQQTPESVRALNQGNPLQQGNALSYPSSQWYNNLLPTEQEQINGAVNWLGINPADWQTMYQRMIPGLSQRQPQLSYSR